MFFDIILLSTPVKPVTCTWKQGRASHIWHVIAKVRKKRQLQLSGNFVVKSKEKKKKTSKIRVTENFTFPPPIYS